MKMLLIILFLYETVCAQEFIQGPKYKRGYQKEISLQYKWHFEIGDSLVYTGSDFNESAWDVIDVPECWENAGYPGYDGYAWYRTRIPVLKKLRNKYLVLRLGRVNDVDEVYINGRKLNQWGYHGPIGIATSDAHLNYLKNRDKINR